MYGDAYRDMTHTEMAQFIWQKVVKFADYANTEQRLPNGKIADVFYQVGQTEVIVEVKTELKQSLIEAAYRKCSGCCHYLAVACPPQLCGNDSAPLLTSWSSEQIDAVGIWWVEWQGLTQVRPAARLDVKTPGRIVQMSPASSPFTVIGSPPCTVRSP